MTAAVVLVALVVVLALRRRRRVAKHADALIVSREDRTASFVRRPGRLKQRGLL